MSQHPLTGERIDLGHGSVAWWPCHIGTGTTVGANTSIGALAHVGQHVNLGENCKIQGSAYIADRSVLGNNVFVGPNATLLNDRYPPSGDSTKWAPIRIAEHAVLGGNSTVIAGCHIGEGSVLGAGSVLTKDLPAGEVWAGNPASFLMTRQEYNDKQEAI
ncbi:N-acetyltransferase [Candidatus Poseidonia alphae]|nr:N-acetyltransferase [Candidatus Poseidonia alphae]MDB2336013.1 N-acetyltransferase [Candidatus Poseidonia alphae]